MLLCQFVRFVLALREGGPRRPARWVAKHLAGCAPCREHEHALAQLANRLGAEAPRLSRTPPPFLVRRVLANLPTHPSARASGPWPRRRAWAYGVAVVAVGIGLGLAFWSPRSPHGQPVVAAGALPPAALGIVSNLASGLTAQETILSMGGKIDEPLQLEWERVVADAQSAARGLAAAFVPEKALDF